MPDYFLDLEREERDDVRVVWAGSATHHGDFHKDVQYGVKRALPGGSGLTVIGYDYRKALRAPDAEYIGWIESLQAFHSSLARYDVGLCPLERTRFNRSKSGIKAMELQAAGVVPIAQDCEAYRGIVTDGEDGFLVRTAKEWQDRLQLLLVDHDLRRRMQAAGLALTAERTYGANAWRWREAYESFVRASSPAGTR
jgi:glycosyltransferase involved in cell wall biosynthesis